MQDPVENTDFLKLGHVDVILDYVYGPITVHLLGSLKTMQPIQFVQAGTLSAQVMELKGAILRGMNLTIRGSGPGSWNMEELSVVRENWEKSMHLNCLAELPVTKCSKLGGRFRRNGSN